MLCITGNEKDLKALESRFKRAAAGGAAGLHEVRLDALDIADDAVFGFLKKRPEKIIACCRPERHGGMFKGSEEERAALLEKAARAGAAYLDVEDDTPGDLVKMLFEASTHAKKIASFHDFGGIPRDIGAILRRMASGGADVVKVAVKVSDAAELHALLDASSSVDSRKVLIGMGIEGVLSRTRYRRFGSEWTYACADEISATAPGQLSLDESISMGLPGSSDGPFIALVGGPQAVRSPGPAAYNRLFKNRGMRFSYHLAVTGRPFETFDLLKRLGAAGASVTMPHKAAAFEYAGPDAAAAEAGAANSIRFDERGAAATNTDVEGVTAPLSRALRLIRKGPGAKALILGAGGAASAAAAACRRLGLAVTVCARDTDKAAGRFGGAGVIHWDRRTESDAEILINATPLGGGSSPWPEGSPIKKAVVFDAAVAAEPSELLRRARDEGAVVITPMDMWASQGAAQLSWITGGKFTEAEIRGALQWRR
jgi:3-dehydroquinate dehydratase type I